MVVLSEIRIRWCWTLCVWVYPQWFLATFSEVLHRKVAENSHIWNQCYSPLGFGFAISNTFKSTVFLSLSHICNWLTDKAWSVKVYHLTLRKTNQQKTSKTISPSPPALLLPFAYIKWKAQQPFRIQGKETELTASQCFRTGSLGAPCTHGRPR